MLEFLTIGEIVNVHGVKGALKVVPLTDDPSRFKKVKKVIITVKGKRNDYDVLSAQVGGNTVVLTVSGITTREQAEFMRGGLIEVPRSEAIELPADTYFIGDLIGCKVLENDDSCLGVITEVLHTCSNDVYSVKDEKGRVILIPAIEDVVKNVDIEAGVVEVELLPGLKEIYYAD